MVLEARFVARRGTAKEYIYVGYFLFPFDIEVEESTAFDILNIEMVSVLNVSIKTVEYVLCVLMFW